MSATYCGPECPHCGSDETMSNRTPMGPSDLAENPWFCTDCRAYFG